MICTARLFNAPEDVNFRRRCRRDLRMERARGRVRERGGGVTGAVSSNRTKGGRFNGNSRTNQPGERIVEMIIGDGDAVHSIKE